MEPSNAEMAESFADYQAAPIFDAVSESTSSDPKYLSNEFPKKSYAEWDQGTCGNCWVWAGTAVLSQSYAKYSGSSVPLSIQFFNSNFEEGNVGMTKPHDWACNGGDDEDFAKYYNTGLDQVYPGLPFVVPWDNRNASYKDRANLGTTSHETYMPKELMATTPNIGFGKISIERVLATTPTNQTEAIRNITNTLLDGKVISYSLYWPDSANVTKFNDFWDTEPDALYDPATMNGSVFNKTAGGSSHAMVLIGYNKTDSDQTKWYWIVQNSWGNTTAGRPAGQFRLRMFTDYNARFTNNTIIQEFVVYNVTWKTDPTVTGIAPSAGENSDTLDFTDLAGTGFRSGAVVNLTREGESDITATDVTIVSATKITGTFNIKNVKAGTYNVVVTNTDNRSGTLANGFTITAPAPLPDGSDQDVSESASLSSPGAAAGATMTFELNDQLSDTDHADIVAVAIVPSETLGQTSLIVADVNSVDTGGLEGRVVNQIMSLNLVGVNPSKVDHATIAFTVSRKWLEERTLKPEQIVLMRNHGGTWSELPTTLDHQTGDAYYFTSVSPGFSYFAITTRKNSTAGTAPPVNASSATTGSSVPANVTAAGVSATPSGSGTSTVPDAKPVANQTTIPPTSGTSQGAEPGIPFLPLVAGIAAIVILALAGFFLWRWRVRRQNPALFRKYD